MINLKQKRNKPDTTLVVGDVHVSPGQNLRRADWLGAFIKDIKPERIVYIGDLITFDSLSAWDKDKRKKMEGRRYSRDIETACEFLARVQVLYKGSLGLLPTILTEGNHEHREARYLDYHPEVDFDYKQRLNLKDEYNINVYPYKEFYKYKGVGFTHVPITESGRPVTGKYPTTRALEICSHSVVFGHTHKLDYSSVHRHGQAHLQEALNVGCYFEHVDEYAQGSVTSYWRGLILLEHYKHGRFKFDTYPMGMLRREYGTKKSGKVKS
jgi:predicted phosphodiesterase